MNEDVKALPVPQVFEEWTVLLGRLVNQDLQENRDHQASLVARVLRVIWALWVQKDLKDCKDHAVNQDDQDQ